MERLQPKFAEIANGTTWYRDISCLPLKPPQSFKPRIVIKTGFFVFLWIWPEPVRGSQREENFQKTSLKARKKFSAFRPPSFLFFKLVSSTPWPFCCFYVMYASFRSVTDKNSKILTPTRTGNFLLTSMDREFYATLRIKVQGAMQFTAEMLGCLKCKISHRLTRRGGPTYGWFSHNQSFLTHGALLFALCARVPL